jgi:hypothetical protein
LQGQSVAICSHYDLRICSDVDGAAGTRDTHEEYARTAVSRRVLRLADRSDTTGPERERRRRVLRRDARSVHTVRVLLHVERRDLLRLVEALIADLQPALSTERAFLKVHPALVARLKL